MNIAILVPSFHLYDAVSQDALGQFDFLIKKNQSVRIYSESWSHHNHIYNIDHIDSFIKKPDDLVVLHHSTFWLKAQELVNRTMARVILKYHNITPAHFFQGINENYAISSQKGLKQILDLASSGRIVKYLADSKFNQSDLAKVGIENVQVLPPFMQTRQLLDIEADLEYTFNLTNNPSTNILMVGRIAPNKGHLPLLEAFARYVNNYNPMARLLIVGSLDENMPLYNQAIKKRILDLKIGSKVILIHSISTAILKSIYLSADLLVMLSEHEGFCVPIVEAQALGIPVLTHDRGALAQTAGSGALVWPVTNPELIASSIHRILVDKKLQSHLLNEGSRNFYQRFKKSVLENQFNAVLTDSNIW